jgi:anti-sigma regulatory factor (Ser/Thr protein kinase)
MPAVPGYDLHGVSRPADETGGDSFDLALLPQGLLVVLADATGHGIGPALSVTQMQGMLRMAFRLGAGLDEAYLHLNNQLDEDLPADRFITAFIGLLDPDSHQLAYHSGGQGPILHWSAASASFAAYRPTCFPLAAMPLASARSGREITLAEGDLLALISDGLFDCRNTAGEEFGQARVEALLSAHVHLSMAEVAEWVLSAFDAFRAGAPQEDDVTLVLIRRLPAQRHSGEFPRRIDALPAIFAFTAESLARLGAHPGLLPTIDFAVEELFTNMVKYSRESAADVRIALSARGGAVEVELVDSDVEAFDPRARPEVDIHHPLEVRQPGGLGIHLVKRMVDDFDYRYVPELRQSTLRFRVAARPKTHGEGGQGNAVD